MSPLPLVECLAASVHGSWRKHSLVHGAKDVVEGEGEEQIRESVEEEAGVAVELFPELNIDPKP